MFRFGSIFLASLYSLMLKIFGRLIYKYVSRTKSCVAEENGSNFIVNRSQKDDRVVSKNSFVSDGLAGKEDLDLQKSKRDSNADTDATVFLQSGLIANSNACQVVFGKNISGFIEEPKTVKLVVREMFLGSDDDLVRSDQTLGCEISQRKESLEQKWEQNLLEFDEESDSSSVCLDMLYASCSTHEDSQEHISEMENIVQEIEEDDLYSEEVYEEKQKDHMEDGILDEQDFSYEVELLPSSNSSTLAVGQEFDTCGNEMLINTQRVEGNDLENWMSNFLDETDPSKEENLEEEHGIDDSLLAIRNLQEKVEDLDDEYIELEPLSVETHVDKESSSCVDANKAVELQEQNIMNIEETTFRDTSEERRRSWDLESDDDDDDDDDEPDVLLEHQHLVEQMKMELKSCRIGRLPTISEECETPKIVEDLKPLKIDEKIEYKDIMEEIQKFFKSYVEKMRKLDILNYQTLHAINFLQLKDSEVFTAGKKKADHGPFTLPKIWPRKVHRIYADPMNKSITEMNRDLELIYVGQLCLSWEILCWLYVKARELLENDCEGNHSYNRAAEEFQQFQVLMQRFIEDEPFQGRRNQNYVKSRCMIRSLLQVPPIRDDCLNTKKERQEETDAITIEMLVGIIRESMLIFQEFLFADKKSRTVVLKGIQGTKIDLQELGKSELLLDIISNLQKKERRIRDQIRSQNCIVKKLKRQQACRLDREILTSQVELRLVSRVLNMSRLTEDQLGWCQKKLKNISFVGRKVHIEPSFLLFPC